MKSSGTPDVPIAIGIELGVDVTGREVKVVESNVAGVLFCVSHSQSNDKDI